MSLTILPDLDQGSDEWLEQRRGMVTAHVAAVLAEQEAQRTADAVDRERVRHGHVARGGAL